MKRHANLWEQLTSFENIHLAFKKAIKGKGYKPYTMQFIENLEHNLITIQSQLIDKTYHPGNYRTFFIYEPKKRMISAAPFVDRIVHHCLINIIGPIFEGTFIAQSYANQTGKGSHKAIRYVQAMMQKSNYIMHCDIRKYFPSIDHDILKALIHRKIKDPNVLWLIHLIIDNSNPQEMVVDYFPGDNLFSPIERRKGLPIGNLTSQFFANIYLNGFDHFVKQTLNCHFYARYVDDFVVADSDKKILWEKCQEMECYLEKLRLRIHPDKKHVRPVKQGLRFLGQFIYPDRRLLPKENIRRFMRRMKQFQKLYSQGDVSLEDINHSLQSWLGHAKQANSFALRRDLMRKITFERK
ncbi:RNA-dependent DNA polymerase [candidate division KSB1 bacterium]|nr:RNA-dependent DNA polymerase [candidate division KSB1 bacterium]